MEGRQPPKKQESGVFGRRNEELTKRTEFSEARMGSSRHILGREALVIMSEFTEGRVETKGQVALISF